MAKEVKTFGMNVLERARELEVSSCAPGVVGQLLASRGVNSTSPGRSTMTRMGQNPYVVIVKGDVKEGKYSGAGTRGASQRFKAAVSENGSELQWLLTAHALPSVKSMLSASMICHGRTQTVVRKQIIALTDCKPFADYIIALGKLVSVAFVVKPEDVKSPAKARTSTASAGLRVERLAAAKAAGRKPTKTSKATAAQKAARPPRTPRQQATHKAEQKKAAEAKAVALADIARAEANAK